MNWQLLIRKPLDKDHVLEISADGEGAELYQAVIRDKDGKEKSKLAQGDSKHLMDWITINAGEMK